MYCQISEGQCGAELKVDQVVRQIAIELTVGASIRYKRYKRYEDSGRRCLDCCSGDQPHPNREGPPMLEVVVVTDLPPLISIAYRVLLLLLLLLLI